MRVVIPHPQNLILEGHSLSTVLSLAALRLPPLEGGAANDKAPVSVVAATEMAPTTTARAPVATAPATTVQAPAESGFVAVDYIDDVDESSNVGKVA
jgi:hypothetical protein